MADGDETCPGGPAPPGLFYSASAFRPASPRKAAIVGWDKHALGGRRPTNVGAGHGDRLSDELTDGGPAIAARSCPTYGRKSPVRNRRAEQDPRHPRSGTQRDRGACISSSFSAILPGYAILGSERDSTNGGLVMNGSQSGSSADTFHEGTTSVQAFISPAIRVSPNSKLEPRQGRPPKRTEQQDQVAAEPEAAVVSPPTVRTPETQV